MGMIERETLLLKCYSYVTASDSMKLLIFCAILIMCIAQMAWAAPEPTPIYYFGGREGGGWGGNRGFGGNGGYGGYGGGWGGNRRG